ncbi:MULTISPECIES: Lsm family RNA-binding protein [Sulfurisphaera]|nr:MULTISPECIES: Lsm family RNA-binding protein [Sulfurisphaera]QGR15962.1 Sm ribonucleo [Sulfurisphaera ohwakuensis]HII74998.1 Lsm family RNA-binding protein [Sulfurisphaera tokodaii]
MMSSRRVATELNSLLDKAIVVRLINNKIYYGTLSSYELSPFILTLTNAKDNDNNTYYKVILNGNSITEILVKSSPIFDPKEFADLVTKELNLRAGDAKVYEEAGVVVILDRIKVSENGVEGSGPLAQRIYDLYNDYINKKKKGS